MKFSRSFWTGRLPSVAALALSVFLLCMLRSAHAQVFLKNDEVQLGFAPSVLHFNPSPEHVHWNHFVSAELHTDRGRLFDSKKALFGLALFANSFGQPSQYLYWGQRYDLGRVGPGDLYTKITAGLLHGYKDQYKDKIPLNQNHVAPAIIPTLGYRYGAVSAEVALLGFNGLLFAVTYSFSPF